MPKSPEYTRRSFLKTAAQTGLFISLGHPLASAVNSVWGAEVKSSPPDLVVVKGDPEKAVSTALDLLGGMKRFVKTGQSVVIKPNMSFAKTPDQATNTSPAVVAAVCRACIEAGAKKVLVLDHTLHKGELCLDMSGIATSCKAITNTHVLALNDKRFFQELPVPQGKVITSVNVLQEVVKSDVLISLPTAKSHSATGVSLGMKGLMGLIWDRGYFHAKVDLHQAIADLTSVVKPHLTIIDASRALITGGPSGPGKIDTLNTIVAGVDPVAVDTFGVGIAPWYNKTFTVDQVKHIMAAYRMGLGTINLDQLQIVKENV
jgi:uncharacterized protein (DUF362 family)